MTRVAVMSLTRDRLKYTRHCFASLASEAGISYDHYVLDNGSGDGTVDWLSRLFHSNRLILQQKNLGLAGGLNILLDRIKRENPSYDVIVKFDNDCEPVTEGFLAKAVDFVTRHPNAVCSPKVLGLGRPPSYEPQGTMFGHRVRQVGHLGGLCHVAPARAHEGFYWDGGKIKLARGADSYFSAHLARQGWRQYYLVDVEVSHYLTTRGQERDPEMAGYFQRKRVEEELPGASCE